MKTEIITLVIVLVLLYTRPSALVRFSNTLLGKVLFVGAVIIASLVNPLAGLFFATLMIILMEQSYEGFKEGLDDLAAPITVKTVGTYVEDTVMITVKSDDASKLASIIPVNRTIIKHATDDTIFDDHTLIKATADSVTITLSAPITEVINAGTDLIIVTGNDSSDTAVAGNYIKYTDTGSKKVVRKVASIDTTEITFENGDKLTLDDIFTYEVVTTVTVKSDTKKYEPSANGTTGYTSITIDSVTDTLDSSSLVIPSTNELVVISSVENTINLTLSSGVKADLADQTSLSIENHSHTHGHSDTDSFVGGRKEGFFAGDEKKETVVKGAYAEETYEDEIVGETVCSSNLCDRIDSEFKLIRPINSNDHTPTNV
tara:strand:- start:2185 stop:3303 length:1119 start_codon:yes stop_codon:yes gene_type:complete